MILLVWSPSHLIFFHPATSHLTLSFYFAPPDGFILLKCFPAHLLFLVETYFAYSCLTSFLSCPRCGPFFCLCLFLSWLQSTPALIITDGWWRLAALLGTSIHIWRSSEEVIYMAALALTAPQSPLFLTAWWNRPGQCPFHICCAGGCHRCPPPRTSSEAAAEGCPGQKKTCSSVSVHNRHNHMDINTQSHLHTCAKTNINFLSTQIPKLRQVHESPCVQQSAGPQPTTNFPSQPRVLTDDPGRYEVRKRTKASWGHTAYESDLISGIFSKNKVYIIHGEAI